MASKTIKPIEGIKYTGVALLLKPIVYKADGGYYCSFTKGSSRVTGYGKTIEEAIEVWDENLKDHLPNAAPGDEISEYVISLLADAAAEKPKEVAKPLPDFSVQKEIEEHIASVKDPKAAEQLRAFYEQFRP